MDKQELLVGLIILTIYIIVGILAFKKSKEY